MSKREVTEWYPADVAPVRPGPYEWCDASGEPYEYPYHWWDGMQWIDAVAKTPQQCAYAVPRSVYDDSYTKSCLRGWRGLKEPA